MGVGRVHDSAGRPPGSPPPGGTPTYIPQHDPHDALMILNIHKWNKFCKKKLPISSGPHNKPRRNPEVGSGVKKFFCVFRPFLNSPQKSDYFEYRHMW